MRWKGITLIAATALLLQGCFVLSLHPLYTDGDTVSESQLLGRWLESPDSPDSSGAWVFEPTDEENAYLLKLIKNDSTEGEFQVHLVKLGGNLFMDLFPKEPEHLNEYFVSHVIPAHSFWRVELEGDTLKLGSLDFDWLKDAMGSGKVDIKHESLENIMLLTAQPSDLQKLLAEHGDEAFKDFEVAYRAR